MRAHALALTCLAACGGGAAAPDARSPDAGPDAAPPDAAPTGNNSGFVTPANPTRAHSNGADVGPADWSCRADAPVPTSVEVALSGTVRDFQLGNQVEGATIDLFVGTDLTAIDSDGPTGAPGTYALTVPSGTSRFGLAVSAPDYADTLVLGEPLAPATASQVREAPAVSTQLAVGLAAIIGITQTPGTVQAYGIVRDCQGREVSGAIATISNVSDAAEHRAGAVTFYMDAGSSLPVRHDQQAATDVSGDFIVLETTPGGTGYLQVWGVPDPGGTLELLAERPLPLASGVFAVATMTP